MAQTPGVITEIPVPGWRGASMCHFKADDAGRYLDVLVWHSPDRSFSDVVAQSQIASENQRVTRLELAGTQQAVLIKSTSGPSITNRSHCGMVWSFCPASRRPRAAVTWRLPKPS